MVELAASGIDAAPPRGDVVLVLPRGRRRIAAILIGYGLAGLVVLGLVSVFAAQSLGTLAPLSASLEAQRRQLVTTLHATAAAMDTAGASAANLNISLDQASASSSQAAVVARGMAADMRGLGEAMNLQILGSQPLVGLGDGFRQAAGQADQLAANLDGVTASLRRNKTDLEAGAAGLGSLRAEVERMAGSIGSMPPFGDPSAGTQPLRLAFLALAFWLAVPAVASLVGGVLLWRAGAPRLRRRTVGRTPPVR